VPVDYQSKKGGDQHQFKLSLCIFNINFYLHDPNRRKHNIKTKCPPGSDQSVGMLLLMVRRVKDVKRERNVQIQQRKALTIEEAFSHVNAWLIPEYNKFDIYCIFVQL
jgi:hypothetical protein